MKTTPATVTVEVLRAFFYDGAVQPVGAKVDLPSGLAVEMIHGQKARISAPPVPAAEPDPAPPAPAAPARRKTKDAAA